MNPTPNVQVNILFLDILRQVKKVFMNVLIFSVKNLSQNLDEIVSSIFHKSKEFPRFWQFQIDFIVLNLPRSSYILMFWDKF